MPTVFDGLAKQLQIKNAIMANVEELYSIDEFQKAYPSDKFDVYTEESIQQYLQDVASVIEKSEDGEDLMEKAKKNLSKLQKKMIINKKGKKQGVWVDTTGKPAKGAKGKSEVDEETAKFKQRNKKVKPAEKEAKKEVGKIHKHNTDQKKKVEAVGAKPSGRSVRIETVRALRAASGNKSLRHSAVKGAVIKDGKVVALKTEDGTHKLKGELSTEANAKLVKRFGGTKTEKVQAIKKEAKKETKPSNVDLNSVAEGLLKTSITGVKHNFESGEPKKLLNATIKELKNFQKLNPKVKLTGKSFQDAIHGEGKGLEDLDGFQNLSSAVGDYYEYKGEQDDEPEIKDNKKEDIKSAPESKSAKIMRENGFKKEGNTYTKGSNIVTFNPKDGTYALGNQKGFSTVDKVLAKIKSSEKKPDVATASATEGKGEGGDIKSNAQSLLESTVTNVKHFFDKGEPKKLLAATIKELNIFKKKFPKIDTNSKAFIAALNGTSKAKYAPYQDSDEFNELNSVVGDYYEHIGESDDYEIEEPKKDVKKKTTK